MSVKRNWFITPYLYILPSLLALIIFMYWPLIHNFILSLLQWNLVSPHKEFVGLDNYRELFSREVFFQTALNTGKYIVGILPFTIAMPIFLATMLSAISSRFFRRIYETLIFAPTILSFAIASFVWVWMYNPLGGVINRFLSFFGLSGRIAWLSDPRLSSWAVVIVSGWRLLGYYLVLFTAALLAVPREYVEASTIDGASAWTIFWKVKWPLISPTTFFVFITTVIFASSQTFIPIHILTHGGPFYSSSNLLYFVYEFAFKYFSIGIASSAAIIVFSLFIVITFIQIRFVEKFVHYGL